MTLVVDASMVVAALVDNGPTGEWADSLLASNRLAAPGLMLCEAANILRRAALEEVSSETTVLAHADLLDLRVALHPYRPFAERAWSLRENVTAYDAWYVTLAETLDAPLATLDVRLSRAPGPTCEFLVPPNQATANVDR